MDNAVKPTPREWLKAVFPSGAKIYLKRRAAIILAVAFVLTSTVVASGLSFDQRVSEARRHMRAACQAVQKIAKADAAERSGIKETAAGEASEAERLWAELAKEYAASVPEGYTGDPAWVQRLDDIRLNIARMGKEISTAQWRPAFLSCAHACSLLATMHEANGVTLAIDAMSILRKEVGLARSFMAVGQPQKALALVKDILAARDGVLLAPPLVTSGRDAYREALPQLSLAVDALAEAARDGAEIRSSLDRLAPLVERLYEMAI
ncbi:MAG: hypothetical protein NTZ26_02135 [Candidatus Aminicenantes bacterium]|nr:hypothetical protein [Candidatus Aminicenantes bacterium]